MKKIIPLRIVSDIQLIEAEIGDFTQVFKEYIETQGFYDERTIFADTEQLNQYYIDTGSTNKNLLVLIEYLDKNDIDGVLIFDFM